MTEPVRDEKFEAWWTKTNKGLGDGFKQVAEDAWQAAVASALPPHHWAAPDEATEGVRALLKAARCPDENCDGNGNSWHVVMDGGGEPQQEQVQCQWCDERLAYLNKSETHIEEKNNLNSKSVIKRLNVQKYRPELG